MRVSKLPQDLIELGYKYGLAGQRVYFPKQTLHTLVTRYVPNLLQEIEATYEERGLTFYEESSARKLFSGIFSKSKIAFKFDLKPRTAASVSSAGWKGWREWFGRKERPRLEQLRIIAQEAGLTSSSLYFSYLEIRSLLRKKQKVTADYYARFHAVPAEAIQVVIDLARASIESCPWEPS
jgi:hypothetical protein